MYHAIVKRIARKNFLRVNRKNYDAILKDCVPNIHHHFGGKHAFPGVTGTIARRSVVEIDANEDSQVVAESLKMRAEYGVEEALADPIVS